MNMAKKKEDKTIYDDVEIDMSDIIKDEPEIVHKTGNEVVMKTSNGKTPICRMDLSPEQKKMLVREELRRIIKTNTDGLTRPFVTSIVRYPEDDSAFSTVCDLFRVDSRIMRFAWEFYKDNVDAPKVRDFVHEVEGIVSPSLVFKKVELLNLN